MRAPPVLAGLALAGLLVLSGCVPAATTAPELAPAGSETPYVPREGSPTAAQHAACETRGGRYQQAGLLGGWMCVRPYADAGKRCTDSAQCEGLCRLSDLPQPPRDDSRVTGVCQADSQPFGCFAEVRDGRPGPALCVD